MQMILDIKDRQLQKKTRLYRGDLSQKERPKHRQQKFRTDWLKMDIFKVVRAIEIK